MPSWTTHNAPGTRHGKMICTVCHKPIEQGDYRMRETAEAYLPQHRACTATWEGWARADSEQRKHQRAMKASTIQELLAEAAERGVTREELLRALATPSQSLRIAGAAGMAVGAPTDFDPTQPRKDEQWLGEFKVVQIDRRDDGKPTQIVVLDANGKRQIAHKHGAPLSLSAVPQVKLKNADIAGAAGPLGDEGVIGDGAPGTLKEQQ